MSNKKDGGPLRGEKLILSVVRTDLGPEKEVVVITRVERWSLRRREVTGDRKTQKERTI